MSAPYGVGTPGSYGTYGTPYAASAQVGLPGSYSYGTGISGRVSPSPYGAPLAAAATPYTYNGMPVGGGFAPAASPYAGTQAMSQPGGYVLPNGQTAPPGSTVVITKTRSRRHSSASRHHPHHSSGDYDYGRDWERERERADRERHERERLRWEQEERDRDRQQYGMDEYGRYGPVGRSYDAGMPNPGYGYGGRY